MFINRELEAKLTKVVDHLAASIGTEEAKEQSLKERIENLETVIDGLKVDKRDLEIAVKTVKTDNELEKKKMDADFNREKVDINHLIQLDKEKAAQTLEHANKMIDLKIQAKENELSEKYNDKVRVIMEARDLENKTLLAAHMNDMKQMMMEIMKRLPTVTVGNQKVK
jgi:hypothetical protein